MNSTEDSFEAIERYLLVMSMTPELQQRISRSAVSIAKSGTPSDCVVVFNTIKDAKLCREMESLRSNSNGIIARKSPWRKTTATYVLDRRLMDTVHDVQDAERVAESECERRVTKTRKNLKPLLLLDCIGSLDYEDSSMQTRIDPSFKVVIDDIRDDHTAATLTMMTPDEAAVTFTLSRRTLLMVRKVIQPQPDARSVTLEFASGGSCKMQIGVTPAGAVLPKLRNGE